MFWQIFRTRHLQVVTGRSDAADLDDVLCELSVPDFLDVAFFMGGLPLSKLGASEDVEERVLIESNLIH